MLADRPCGRALQSAKQKPLSAPLRGPQCRKASTPGALLVLFLYFLCATSAAGFFNLEIPFSLFQRVCGSNANNLLRPVSSDEMSPWCWCHLEWGSTRAAGHSRPAVAGGIQSDDSTFPKVCGVDPRFRGNDCVPNDTSTQLKIGLYSAPARQPMAMS